MLTENAIKILENAVGITGLQEMIANEEAVEITPKKTKHFDEVSYNIMYDNLTKDNFTKDKYEEAKKAGYEMVVKKIREGLGLEFEGKTAENLLENINKKIELLSKNDLTEKETEYQKDLEALKKQIQAERTEKENLAQQRKNDKINWLVDNHFNQLQIDIPAHIKDAEMVEQFRKTEIEKNKIYFKSKYNFDLEGEQIIPKDINGNILKDDLQSPKKLDVLISEFAKANIINLAQPRNGRGEGDKFPSNNGLSDIKSVEALMEYAEKKGIKKNTSEFDAIYIEYEKNIKT